MKNNYFSLSAAEQRLIIEQTATRLSLLTSMQGVDYTPDVRDRIQLVPPKDCQDNWRNDYELMTGAMIYGAKPTFAKLLSSMNNLEQLFRNRE